MHPVNYLLRPIRVLRPGNLMTETIERMKAYENIQSSFQMWFDERGLVSEFLIEVDTNAETPMASLAMGAGSTPP